MMGHLSLPTKATKNDAFIYKAFFLIRYGVNQLLTQKIWG